MHTTPLLLSDREAAALLGIGRATFWRYVGAGRLPRPVKLGNVTRWRRAELEAAIDALSADAAEARGAA
jgi:excisionase family DNA binding protein